MPAPDLFEAEGVDITRALSHVRLDNLPRRREVGEAADGRRRATASRLALMVDDLVTLPLEGGYPFVDRRGPKAGMMRITTAKGSTIPTLPFTPAQFNAVLAATLRYEENVATANKKEVRNKGLRLHALVNLGDLGAGLDAQLGVQVGEWLVQQEHLRGTHQRAAQRDTLALPT